MKNLRNLLVMALLPFFGTSQLTEHEVRQMTQTASEQQLVVECSRMLQDGYFFYSEIVVDRLLQINPNSANYQYRKGYIVLDSRLDWITAMPYLEAATSSIDKNYDMYSAKEKSAPADVYYHLARCYHLDEQLDKAKEYFNKFIEVSNAKSVNVAKAQLMLIQCDVAKNLIANPKSARVTNVGKVINTVYPEYSPAISLDGSALYFTSRRQWEDQSTDDYRDPQLNQFPEDIYVSFIGPDNEWTSPERLAFCTGKLNEATVTVSPDERRVYTYEDRTGNGDIYYSDFKMNEFQKLNLLEINSVNTKYWETHCTVTPDGLNMYFVSDRPGGLGGRDIYRVVKLPNGKWSEPINLGPTINTPYDEDSPFIAVDNKTLYYSSNGPSSMGGFDIFVTVRDNNNKWSEPINLGYPINSTGDDVFYTTTANGTTAYLTSFRKNGFGEKDIYKIENDYLNIQNVAVLKGLIRTSDGSRLPESVFASIQCLDCGDNMEYSMYPRIRDGAFYNSLVPCREYVIKFKYDSLSPVGYSEKFKTSCELGYEEIYKEIILDVNKKTFSPVRNYILDGIVADKANGQPINLATVKIKDNSTGKEFEMLSTDLAGFFKSKVLEGRFYGQEVSLMFTISKDGYITQSFDFNQKLEDKLEFHLKYLLEKSAVGVDLAKTLELNPIYFDLDKSNIRPDAKIELDKIVKVLNDNPTLVVEIGSHTDCRASAAYNKALSTRRAISTLNYIKPRISNPSRIYGKGYGESQLITNCPCEDDIISSCSEDEHQANRRTEFRIVKQ